MKAFNQSSIFDCTIIDLPRVTNPAGNITALNGTDDLPFDIKRVYYLYDVPGGETRGGHAHKALQQYIIAANGSFDVVLDDGKQKRTISLNRPYKALHIVPGIWRELNNFSSGSNCLVLASELFDEDDYYRDYKLFSKEKEC